MFDKMRATLASTAKYPLALMAFLLSFFLIYGVMKHVPAPQIGVEHIERARQIVEQHEESVYLSGTAPLSDTRLMAANLRPVRPEQGRASTNGIWEVFTDKVGFEAYAYSAFYDDRKSLGSLPIVRVIVVAEDIGEPYVFCLLKYATDDNGILIHTPEHVKVKKMEIGAGVSRHNKNFKEYIYSCEMTHEEVPISVSIVGSERDSSKVNIPVETPLRPGKRAKFGMCISVTYWRHDPHQIVEWMELLRILGVGHVTVYNNSLEHESARVFEHYSRLGFVDLRQSHNFITDPGELTIHLHMSPVINDCMYRNMYKFKKIIVTDLDEVIVPRTVDNYEDLLVAIDQSQGIENNHPAKHYLFRNNYFFVDIPGEDEEQSRHLVTMRHRKKVSISEQGYAIKSIIDPLACITMHNHYCWTSTYFYNTAFNNIEVEPNIALNHHYKRCHLDMWEKPGKCKELIEGAVKDDVMLRYRDRLMKSVAPQWKRLGLSP